MTKIRELHEHHFRLHQYLQSCRLPQARLYAVALFLDGAPASLSQSGVEYFLKDLLPVIVDCGRTEAVRVVDPRHRAFVRNAFRKSLTRAWGQSPGADALRSLIQDLEQEIPPLPELSPPEDDRQVTILIPLVQEVPSFSRNHPQPTYLGIVAPVTVTARMLQGDERADRWLQHSAKNGGAHMERLEDVSAIALVAGRLAAHRHLQGAEPTERDVRAGLDGKVGFDFMIGYAGLPVAGQSMGLGLAAIIAAEWAGREKGGNGFRPSGRLAWTGRIMPNGIVSSVRLSSLRAKVRAVFYEGLRGLVVPQRQADEARAMVPRGGSSFEVFGVEDLASALSNHRLWTCSRSLTRRMTVSRRRHHRTRLLPITVILLLVLGLVAIRERKGSTGKGAADGSALPVSVITESPDGTILAQSPGVRTPIALRIPEPYPPKAAGTLVLGFRGENERKGDWILAWSQRPEDGAPPALFCWSSKGKELFRILATTDAPFIPGPLNAQKRLDDVRTIAIPGETGQGLLFYEYANAATSTARLMKLDPAADPRMWVTEMFRYYHYGHLRGLALTPGPEPGSMLAWMVGSINSAAIQEATNSTVLQIFCLVCVAVDGPGRYAFSPWKELDPGFMAGASNRARRGQEVFYFALRTFRTAGDVLDWSDPMPLYLDRIAYERHGDRLGVEVLTKNDVGLRASFEPSGQVLVDWYASGALPRILDKLAREHPEGSYQHFVADSVAYLAFASRTITGRFQDVRPLLPEVLP